MFSFVENSHLKSHSIKGNYYFQILMVGPNSAAEKKIENIVVKYDSH